MEYLMTYGWAILIIAVVLGAMFELGIFGSLTSGPRAQAGSCEVYRPYGPGTAAGASLAGQCGGLLPQYVAQFNGQSSQIQINGPFQTYPEPFTYVIWVRYTAVASHQWPYLLGSDNTHIYYGIRTSAYGASVYFEYGKYPTCDGLSGDYTGTGGLSIADGQWHQVAYTWDGSTLQGYMDGKPDGSSVSVSAFCPGNNAIYIGGSNPQIFGGQLANAQVYNASLSQSEILALYQEGIGGAPIAPQYLVGWWPLNGNANDYSGDNYDGQASKVSFTGQWSSSYTAP